MGMTIIAYEKECLHTRITRPCRKNYIDKRTHVKATQKCESFVSLGVMVSLMVGLNGNLGIIIRCVVAGSTSNIIRSSSRSSYPKWETNSWTFWRRWPHSDLVAFPVAKTRGPTTRTYSGHEKLWPRLAGLEIEKRKMFPRCCSLSVWPRPEDAGLEVIVSSKTCIRPYR